MKPLSINVPYSARQKYLKFLFVSLCKTGVMAFSNPVYNGELILKVMTF